MSPSEIRDFDLHQTLTSDPAVICIIRIVFAFAADILLVQPGPAANPHQGAPSGIGAIASEWRISPRRDPQVTGLAGARVAIEQERAIPYDQVKPMPAVGGNRRMSSQSATPVLAPDWELFGPLDPDGYVHAIDGNRLIDVAPEARFVPKRVEKRVWLFSERQRAPRTLGFCEC